MLLSQAIVITFFICLIVPISLAKYGESCITPVGEQGKCVPVRSCAGAYEVFENVYKYGEEEFKDEISFLKESVCESFSETPLICCSNEKIQINPEVYSHLQNQNCGSTLSTKVSGGEEASLFQFRWMALLKYDGKEPFACGGSLIDDRHVLTAAHCLHNFTNPPIAVRLGEYNLKNKTDCLKYGKRVRCLDPVQDIGIKDIIVHEDYVYKSIHHDIAILRLERPVNLNTKSIQTICLPISEELQTNIPEEYQIAGWGQTQFGYRSNVLLWASVPNCPHFYCEDSLGLTLTEDHICAGGRQFRDTCKGDSGGPLFSSSIYVDGVVRAVQYGVVSMGATECGQRNVPAVYVNIPRYMQWITDHMIIEDEEYTSSSEFKSSEIYSSSPFIMNSGTSYEVKSGILFSLLLLHLQWCVDLSDRS